MTSVCLRIGWCQPGENRAWTLSAAGVPNADDAVKNPDEDRDLRWFQNMWLSNTDLIRVVTAAVQAAPTDWPSRGIIVNAMSGNTGMAWDIETARKLLGYEPIDDVRRALAEQSSAISDE